MWKKLVLVLTVLLIIGFVVWQYFKPVPSTRVQAITPVVQSLSTKLDLNAVVINDQIVTITALLDGEIKEIKTREGEQVKRTQALAILDNQQAQSLLDKAKAELAFAEQKSVTASRSYSRVQNLSRAGSASRQTLDDALDALRQSESEKTIAANNIILAELQIQNSTVKAPFDGIVTEQYAEAGQWVEAGTPMFRLVAKDAYLIEAQVDASDWTSVYIDQPVTLTTESAPGLIWQSTVSWIAPSVAESDRGAKEVALRFALGEDSPPLLLGQEVDAELILKQVDGALTLPLSAMVETAPNQYSVFLAKDDIAKLTPVEVGLQNNMHGQIVSGITEQERVIVTLGEPLKDGMPVAF